MARKRNRDKLRRINTLFLISFSLIFTLSIGPGTNAQDFQEPVNNLTLSGRNEYGTYNFVKLKQLHSGIDV